VNRANVVERVAWAFDPFEFEDYSTRERQDVFKLAWETFARSPVLGEGIGATEAWAERGSTHNIYLYYMAEYGIIGAFIVPALTLVCILGARGEARQVAVPFTICVLVLAFFSHNITSGYHWLVAFALMAAMSAQSRTV
jgi:O-antigen ligase